MDSKTASKVTGAVFALIIGINDYQEKSALPPLRGAVDDALAFKQYLLDPREECGLGTPPNNIAFLNNKEATQNSNIPDGGEATMILFYAGHGTRVKSPDAFDGHIEGLCPVDERTTDAKGYVHAIPDYVLGWLLEELSRKKGPNIAVILDSCHSGGMNRTGTEGTVRNARTTAPPIPLELDNHLWAGRTNTAQDYSIWAPTARSHILLAACRAGELAFETEDNGKIRGRFTKALIAELHKARLENTTYVELLDRLPQLSAMQTPTCTGAGKSRLLFSGNYPMAGRRSLPLVGHAQDGQETWRVQIGTVEGVLNGTEFSVIAEDDSRTLCTLLAESVEIRQTILVRKDRNDKQEVPEGARVVVTDWKDDTSVLRVYTPLDFPYREELFPTKKIVSQPFGRKYVEAPSRDEAELVLDAVDGKIVIKREGNLGGDLNVPQGRGPFPALVDGIAHFSYFLERHHPSAPLPGVSLEMHRLQGQFPERVPDTSCGPKKDGNLVDDGKVQVKFENNAMYGFTIRNIEAEDLYAYLFYFDLDDYTIQLWTPPSPADPSLRAHGGIITLGMRTESAFEFNIPSGFSSSSGFLKLFVATKAMNIEWIEQRVSPFDSNFKDTGRKMVREVVMERWDAVKVMLTMVE
ncbi:Protein TIC 214 [Mycena sanguinolenta]|uniref:Protein TIC 214 n=1 Tax=Mycena sanguinolenta TaxID=230812 RepID=A0A8H7CG89_9AGAR|nr:Protein TIC 214 [Mycena sanguinolenta]